MAKIVSMSSGAIDPINVTKRVFWRPATPGTVLKVGQPVCYDSDADHDHKERTVDPTHIGLTIHTYADGAQDKTGRLFVVEEPLTDNLNAFAGICKSLGPKAGADGDMIEIFTPVEGAMVPVWTDENCIEERTILGIRDGEASASYPGRPIGVAQETYDRSGGTIDGMVWMKFRNFEYDATNAAGDATANALIIDDEASANAITIKALNVRFDGTGRARMLYYVGEINGAGHSLYGMFKFRTYISAAASKNAHCLCANLVIKDDGTLSNAGGEHASSAMYVTVETEVSSSAPTLSGGTLAAFYIGYYVDEGTAAPVEAFPFYFNTNQALGQWDGLLRTRNINDIGAYVSSGDAPGLQTGDAMIPVKLGDTTYYLVAFQDSGV